MEVEHLSKPYHLRKGRVMWLLSLLKHIPGLSFLSGGESLGRVRVKLRKSHQDDLCLQAFADFSFPCSTEGCEGSVFRLGVLCGRENFIRISALGILAFSILPEPISGPVICERCNEPCSLDRVAEINAAIGKELVWEVAEHGLDAA